MRIFVQHQGFVNEQLLRSAGHKVVDSCCGDIGIWITDMPRGSMSKSIMIYSEPPLDKDYTIPYASPEKFHTCFLFGNPTASNTFDITTDPIVYPYYPCIEGDVWRASTELRSRKVFFAGTRFGHPKGGDLCGRIDLYDTRSNLVIGLRRSGIAVRAEGIGWESESRKVPAWGIYKIWLARGCEADFHLCCENSAFRNYVTEKIHGGFQSDLGVLYLGCPQIEDFVPREAFINLNPYYDPVSREVDAGAVAARLKEMTQSQYDRMIKAARDWRRGDMLKERYLEQRDRVTRMILGRI